ISAGSAFLYSGATAVLIRRLDGQQAFAYFGGAVAGAGDVDGDGIPDLLVGAPLASPNGLPNAGSAFLFSGATGSLLRTFHGLTAFEQFGQAVVSAGDVDGDGTPEALIGAPRASANGLTLSGSVLLFSGSTGSPLFRFDGLAQGDNMGSVVCGAGDVDGDGRADFLAGSGFADPDGHTEAGMVLLFGRNPILTASAETLSVTAGGTVDYAIDFPAADAGASYQILMSAHGTGPTLLHGLLIPLARDNFFRASLHGSTPPQASGFQGILDAEGKAAARITAPPGALPLKLLGRRFPLTLAVVNGRFDFASVARSLEFTL
ncbi:MAG: integrin alpha, partial [Nitrospinota bacterium]